MKPSDNLFPYLHLVPAAAPSAPAAGSQRLYLDSGNSNKLSRKDSAGSVTVVEGGGSSATELLATTGYNPGTGANTTAGTTTGADVDATNLAVTFTAPASGNVLAVLSAVTDVSGGGGANLRWCLRSGSTNVTGSDAMVAQSVAGNVIQRTVHRVKITGLTAGASYTWKFGHYCNNTGVTQRTSYGGIYGQALMEVWSA